MQNALHPVMAATLQAIVDQPKLLRRAAYVASLRTFDWQFEYSDDHGYWRRSKDTLLRMQQERAAIDPDGAVWNENCGDGFKFLPARNGQAVIA